MTVTLSSVTESTIMAGCGSVTLCYVTGFGWVCTLCSGTWVGWGSGLRWDKARWRKVDILLYAFCISEPYLSEGIVFSFFIDRMASMLEAV